MLVVEGLVARYGAVVALHGIDLRVDAGETVAVVGPNGAGKTTLMRALSGLMKPSAGTITFDGQAIGGRKAHKVAKLGLAHVPEGRAILAPLTVRENLLMGGYLVAAGEREERIGEMAELFPVLGERMDSAGGVLSGGEQQMLAIARGLMSRPRLLLIDEPSMGLAPKVVDDVMGALGKVVESGTSVIIAEQNAGLALDVASRAYVLVTGEVVADGPSTSLADTLLDTYLA